MPPLAIRLSRLVKTYPGGVEAVRGLDLEVRAGECFGLLGPNGAGKTTTIEILEGLLAPSAGEAEVLGERWGRDDRRLRERLGISLQETRLSEKLTVKETVRLFRSFYRSGPDPATSIRLVGLEEKAGSRVGKLSGGEKQRLAFACAIVGDPELLFLDEPTTGLDPQSRRQVWDIITRFRERGRTVLLTTHYMEEAERLCDRVAIVDHGRTIAIGSPAELIASLGGDHVIEFAAAGVGETEGPGPAARAASPASPLELRELEALPSVSSARVEGREVALTVTEPHRVLPALLDLLRSSGRELARLSIRHASLEDVFVALAGRHFPDGEVAGGDAPGGGIPGGGVSGGDAPAGGAPGGDAPASEAPAGGASRLRD
jgi:ABC-2 type transport system ATP-binding protein